MTTIDRAHRLITADQHAQLISNAVATRDWAAVVAQCRALMGVTRQITEEECAHKWGPPHYEDRVFWPILVQRCIRCGRAQACQEPDEEAGA